MKNPHFTTHHTHAQKGFTLVETLVAVSVLLLAIAGPLTLGSQGLTASRIARDQITATYLIQEAIEYIRNTRDTNVLSGNGWLSDLSKCTTGTCFIDVSKPIQSGVDGCEETCPVFTYNPNTGVYGYTEDKPWEATKFVRAIEIEETVAGVEAKLIVSITWQDGLLSRTVSVDEYLLNWQ